METIKKIKRVGSKVLSGDTKVLKKKVLTKAKAKGPIPISTRRALQSFTHNTEPLVKEVEREEVTHDDRSLFFQSELAEEQRGNNKWLR